jgi:hypothetical protein
MSTIPSEAVPPYIVCDRGPTHETRAFVTPQGVRLEVWTRGPDAPVTVGKDALVRLARIASLPPGGAR